MSLVILHRRRLQQTAEPAYITLDPTSYDTNSSASTFSIAVDSNIAWTAVSENGFITITSGASGNGAGTIQVSVAEHTSATIRTGNIKVEGGGVIKYVGVNQQGVESEPLLMDTYPGYIAITLDKLRSGYTGASVRVRNESNVELDIGFNSNNGLNESELLNHVGSGNGYVVEIYPKAGSLSAYQPDPARQPLIATNGVIEKENGKPCVSFIIAGSHLIVDTNLEGVSAYSYYAVFNMKNAINYETMFNLTLNSDPSEDIRLRRYAGNNYFQYGFGNADTISQTQQPVSNKQVLVSVLAGGGTVEANVNSVNDVTDNQTVTLGVGSLFIGGRGSTLSSNGTFQELLFFKNKGEADKDAIETAINTRYSIY